MESTKNRFKVQSKIQESVKMIATDRKQLSDDVRIALLESDSDRHLKHHEEVMVILKDIQKTVVDLPCKESKAERVGLEKRITALEKGYWKACIVSAIIGGLVARLAPDMLWKMIEAVFKVHVTVIG